MIQSGSNSSNGAVFGNGDGTQPVAGRDGGGRPNARPVALVSMWIAIALGLAFCSSLVAAPVRVSFLSHPAALQDTIRVLQTGGCREEATRTFQRAVGRYGASTFSFDLGKFPEPHDGFYEFASPTGLVAALPHQLADTAHAYEFNCFDTVVALSGDSLRIRVRPDDLSGPYMVPHTQTNGAFSIVPRATARDAFNLAYPQWYRDATQEVLPQSMRDGRVSLVASLFRCHMLPQSTTEEGLAQTVMETLRASWTGQGLSLPPRFEVVLCHEVSFPQRWFVTAHAGLLLAREQGFTYLEKAGGKGPFVRLDVPDRAALLAWFRGMFRGAEKLGYTHHFATFNDTKVERIEFLEK